MRSDCQSLTSFCFKQSHWMRITYGFGDAWDLIYFLLSNSHTRLNCRASKWLGCYGFFRQSYVRAHLSLLENVKNSWDFLQLHHHFSVAQCLMFMCVVLESSEMHISNFHPPWNCVNFLDCNSISLPFSYVRASTRTYVWNECIRVQRKPPYWYRAIACIAS